LKKPVETLDKLARFLGKDYSEDQLRTLVAETSFKTFKSRESEDPSVSFLMDIQWWERDMQFFRKGQVGNWREHFTEEMSKRMDEALASRLKSKVEFNYGGK
jgi:hypothetical protein